MGLTARRQFGNVADSPSAAARGWPAPGRVEDKSKFQLRMELGARAVESGLNPFPAHLALFLLLRLTRPQVVMRQRKSLAQRHIELVRL